MLPGFEAKHQTGHQRRIGAVGAIDEVAGAVAIGEVGLNRIGLGWGHVEHQAQQAVILAEIGVGAHFFQIGWHVHRADARPEQDAQPKNGTDQGDFDGAEQGVALAGGGLGLGPD